MGKHEDPDDEVGPAKPPRSSQFKPGQSGNPNGRPKGSKNLRSLLEQQLRRMVPHTVNGRLRRTSGYDLIVQGLRNDALRGDARARELIFKLLVADKDPSTEASSEPFPTLDAAALRRMRQRVTKLIKETEE